MCLSHRLSSAPGKRSITLDTLLLSWLQELQAEQPWGEAHLRLKNHCFTPSLIEKREVAG